MNIPQNGKFSLLFSIAASMIDPLKVSCYYLIETMKTGEFMIEISLHDATSEKLAEAKAMYANFWALTLACFMNRNCVQISGRWENVVWKIIGLSRNWMPGFTIKFSKLIYTKLRPWILMMFSNQKLCPNPHLRLELLCFIGMWPETYLQEATAGQQAAAGLVNMSSYLQMEYLSFSDSETSLLYHLVAVLYTLCKYGHLDAVVAASVSQVRNLRVGRETVFFNGLIQLLNQMVEVTRDKYLAGDIDALQTTVDYDSIFDLFKLLVITPPNMAVYESPGLAQAAVASLVNMTSVLVSLGPKLQLEDPDRHVRLFSSLEGVFQFLNKSTPISSVLGQNHAHSLAFINHQSAKSGFLFHNFPTPCEELTEECPEEFMDSVMGSVMKAPVLLHSSKMVVDESTLLHLLLVSPSDPFTRCPLDHGSYSRLPHLQADINAWRNTGPDTQATTSDDSASVHEGDISDFEVFTDNTRDSDIDMSACPLQFLLRKFHYN